MVTCLEKAVLLALLYVMFSCVFVNFPSGVIGQVWYFIVSIPDLCLLPYFQSRAALVVSAAASLVLMVQALSIFLVPMFYVDRKFLHFLEHHLGRHH